jgi:hypothetical protein
MREKEELRVEIHYKVKRIFSDEPSRSLTGQGSGRYLQTKPKYQMTLFHEVGIPMLKWKYEWPSIQVHYGSIK